MTQKMTLAHTFENYRDFEPSSGIQFNGYARVTFNDENHTAYALPVNPAATVDNFEPTYLDDAVTLSWEAALDLIEVDA